MPDVSANGARMGGGGGGAEGASRAAQNMFQWKFRLSARKIMALLYLVKSQGTFFFSYSGEEMMSDMTCAFI